MFRCRDGASLPLCEDCSEGCLPLSLEARLKRAKYKLLAVLLTFIAFVLWRIVVWWEVIHQPLEGL